ncbi:hypothetical protein Tco_1426314, partial [Tanacetum coccineum]
DLGSVETKFPTIVFNDTLTSEAALLCESTVSSLNDEIDFKISFDDFDDEDYTVIYDKKSFSYKIISVNDLKTDSENDNEKVNMPLFLSPEPTVSCFDDLDFFKDFENEFPTIVYNDALTSKSDFLTEPTLSPQHIEGFNLKDETSLSECDEEEQNVLYFNDLFSFPINIIHPDDLKLEKDNDDNEIDIIQSLRVNEITQGSKLLSESYMALPPRGQRHQYVSFNWVELGGADSARQIPHKGDLRDYWIAISSAGDFLGTTPSYTLIRDLILRDGRWPYNIPYLLARYLRFFAAGRKSGAHISGRQFVACLAEHFGLLTSEILQGLTVIAPKLLFINMSDLVRLQICKQIDDTWAWVAMGPERQPDVAAGALRVGQDAPTIDEGVQADPTPV